MHDLDQITSFVLVVLEPLVQIPHDVHFVVVSQLVDAETKQIAVIDQVDQLLILYGLVLLYTQ